jgi:hypothetical protein
LPDCKEALVSDRLGDWFKLEELGPTSGGNRGGKLIFIADEEKPLTVRAPRRFEGLTLEIENEQTKETLPFVDGVVEANVPEIVGKGNGNLNVKIEGLDWRLVQIPFSVNPGFQFRFSHPESSTTTCKLEWLTNAPEDSSGNYPIKLEWRWINDGKNKLDWKTIKEFPDQQTLNQNISREFGIFDDYWPDNTAIKLRLNSSKGNRWPAGVITKNDSPVLRLTGPKESIPAKDWVTNSDGFNAEFERMVQNSDTLEEEWHKESWISNSESKYLYQEQDFEPLSIKNVEPEWEYSESSNDIRFTIQIILESELDSESIDSLRQLLEQGLNRNSPSFQIIEQQLLDDEETDIPNRIEFSFIIDIWNNLENWEMEVPLEYQKPSSDEYQKIGSVEIPKPIEKEDSRKFKSLCHPDKLKLIYLKKTLKSLEPRCEKCGALSQSWSWKPGDEISCNKYCGWKGTPELSNDHYTREIVEDWWDRRSLERKGEFYIFTLSSDKSVRVGNTKNLLMLKKGNYEHCIRE